jgi:hypothetical protein
MDPTENITVSLETLKAMKLDAAKRQGPRNCDLPIIVLVGKDGLDLFCFSVHASGDDAHARVIGTALALSDGDAVTLCSDTYYCTSTKEAPIHELPNYGDLGRRFDVKDPAVVEALTVIHRTATDPLCRLVVQPYTFAGRRLDWGAPMWGAEEHAVEGLLTYAMDFGFQGQHTRPGPPLPPLEIAELLDLDLVTVSLQPPRNGPCPCGSGFKSKQCCWGVS